MAEALDGVGRVVLPVSEGVRNVIGALHSSGVAALADAAALAAVLSVAADEAAARRLQPLGVEARLTFRRPTRGTALATDGDQAPGAAEGEFDWVLRLAPS